MSNQARGVLERLRNPEYTGDDRCVPCTVLNLVLALVIAALAALIAVELAVAVFGISVLLIALRGYLVPGTPAITEQFLPESILARFDAHPADDPEWETLQKHAEHDRNAVDPEQFLVDAGAVETDGDERRLASDFADAVERRERELRGAVERDAVAAVFGADPDEISFEEREYPAFSVGHRIRKWPSDAALVADVAAHRALDERVDQWGDVPIEHRLDVLASVRTLRDACPDCDGALETTSETVESCCRTGEIVALLCRDCGAHLVELDPASPEAKHLT